MKVNCNLCGRKVEDAFTPKWRHVIKYHPQESLVQLLPLMCNPELAREAGRLFADKVKQERHR
jgi:hypothetical protein